MYFIHKALHHGKTQSGAFLGVAGGVHRLHGFFYIGDANAAVGDGDAHHAALIEGRRQGNRADTLRIGVHDTVGDSLGHSSFEVSQLRNGGVKLNKERCQRRTAKPSLTERLAKVIFT